MYIGNVFYFYFFIFLYLLRLLFFFLLIIITRTFQFESGFLGPTREYEFIETSVRVRNRKKKKKKKNTTTTTTTRTGDPHTVEDGDYPSVTNHARFRIVPEGVRRESIMRKYKPTKPKSRAPSGRVYRNCDLVGGNHRYIRSVRGTRRSWTVVVRRNAGERNAYD